MMLASQEVRLPLLFLPFAFSQSLPQTRRVALTAGPVHLFLTLTFSATA